MLTIEKRSFFIHHIKSFSTDGKQLWSKLKSLGVINSKSDKQIQIPDVLKNPEDINNLFIDSIPTGGMDSKYVDEFLSMSKSNSLDQECRFELKLVTIEDVENTVWQLKSFVIGVDGISAKMLQLGLPWFSPPLTHIINCSIEHGTIPDLWKIAKITPIPKKANIQNIIELRPISLLAVPSKIAEKLIYTQLYDYVTVNNILPDIQSGFRKGHSTTTALSHIVDDILRARDNTQVTSLVLIDMTKAFDCIDFKGLLTKLKCYGMDGTTFNWFENYVTGRMQYTSLMTCAGEEVSNLRELKSGVPQGSVLGPLLFSIFTADLCKGLQYCSMHLYADDAQIYYSYAIPDKDESIIKLQTDLDAFHNVCEQNGFIINPNKSQFINFGTTQLLNNLGEMQIRLGNKIIPSVTTVKNLGITFDPLLKFSEHVGTICRRGFFALKQVAQFRTVLDENTKIMLVEALVLSHLNYASTVFGPCINNTERQRIQKIQNYCVRFITPVQKYAHITPYIRQLGMLKLNERRFIQFLCFVLNIINTGKPKYLLDKLTWRNEVHTRYLRGIDNALSIPLHRTTAFEMSFSYLATYVLNKVPIDVRSGTIKIIKRQMKTKILSNTTDMTIDYDMF